MKEILQNLPKKFLALSMIISWGVSFILLIIVIIFLIIFGFSSVNHKEILESKEKSFKEERQEWYASHYYLNREIDNSAVVAYQERKKNFQLKIAGIMKDANTNLTDKEILKYTEYIFDKSEELGWDSYLAIAVAWKESKFNKKAIGYHNDRGLYQFLPSTARLVSKFANLDYYIGIEYNVIDTTKLWFSYMRILVDMFDGNIECALLSYNIGERRLIELSGIKMNKEAGVLNVQSANLSKVRKLIYYDRGKKLGYDEDILHYMYRIKMKGIADTIKKENK